MMTEITNLPGVQLAPGIWTDRTELRFAFSRSSGPGGQNVNKVNTKTELRVSPMVLHGLSEGALKRLSELAGRRITGEGDILIVSERERTQEANRTACLRRLREMLVAALVEPIKRRKTRPTRASKQRRIQSKKLRSRVKEQRKVQW